MKLTAGHWTAAACAVAFATLVTLGASGVILDGIAATGIGTRAEIVNLLARGN